MNQSFTHQGLKGGRVRFAALCGLAVLTATMARSGKKVLLPEASAQTGR